MQSAAQAATVDGIVNIDIYTYDAGGSSANAAATVANLTGKTLTAQVTYEGLFDWFTDGPNTTTVDQFLNSSSVGSYVLNAGSTSGLLTTGGFNTTTLFDFTGYSATAFSGTIRHDDGISFYDDGALITPASAANPTTPVDTAYSFDGGDFRLIYAAANGNPEQLLVTASEVPIPAAAWFFGSGLIALAGLKHRKS